MDKRSSTRLCAIHVFERTNETALFFTPPTRLSYVCMYVCMFFLSVRSFILSSFRDSVCLVCQSFDTCRQRERERESAHACPCLSSSTSMERTWRQACCVCRLFDPSISRCRGAGRQAGLTDRHVRLLVFSVSHPLRFSPTLHVSLSLSKEKGKRNATYIEEVLHVHPISVGHYPY